MMTRGDYFEETFKSPFPRTKEDALKELEEIRKNHPASSGWEELAGYVEPFPRREGWRAVRKHRKPKSF